MVMATEQIPLQPTVLDLFDFGLKTSPLNIHETIYILYKFYKIKDKFVKSQPQVALFGLYKSHDKLGIILRRTSSRDLTQLMFASSPSIWSNMTVRQVVRVKIPNLTHFYVSQPDCEVCHFGYLDPDTQGHNYPQFTRALIHHLPAQACLPPKKIDKEKLSFIFFFWVSRYLEFRLCLVHFLTF